MEAIPQLLLAGRPLCREPLRRIASRKTGKPARPKLGYVNATDWRGQRATGTLRLNLRASVPQHDILTKPDGQCCYDNFGMLFQAFFRARSSNG